MIAVDTSALMAIVLQERWSLACREAIAAEDRVLISAGTLVEALIVSRRKDLYRAMAALIEGAHFTVIAVTEATAQRISLVYDRWGRGIHPAALNFGDCFAYDVAKQHDCALLYVGDDFSKTDVKSVL